MAELVAYLALWIGCSVALIVLFAAAETVWDAWSEHRGPAMMAEEFPLAGGWSDADLEQLVADFDFSQ